MSNIRTASGREFRSAGLIETPLPFTYDAALMPGARVLGDDGQIYESMRDVVSGAYAWAVRARGERGPAVELQQSITHIQWRVEGSTGPWTNLAALVDLVGPAGPAGPAGPQGAGLSYQGSVATVGDLPTPSTTGYAYLVTGTGDLWIYSGTAWNNAGPIQGPAGPIGPAGATGPAGAAGADGADGADGAAVELRKTTTEIQWRLVGDPTWITLVSLSELQGPVGDTGPTGPAGPGFSYQGSVATVGDLPIPSTQGFGFLVTATGDLHIYSGTAWVNAGPLQGPPGADGIDGATGATGPAGATGNSFSYQGEVATVGDLPSPSTTGFAYKVTATGDLHIYNGTAWVNAGPLQGVAGPAGATGPQGPAGPTGPTGVVAATAPITYDSVTQTVAINVGTTAGTVAAGDDARITGALSATAAAAAYQPLDGDLTAIAGLATTSFGRGLLILDDAAAGRTTLGLSTTSSPQFAALGLGTAAVAGWELTVAGGMCQLRQSVTISGSTYTLDVQAANEFVTAAAINGATTINLSNLNTIPSGYTWRGVLSFQYTSGTVTWFGGNTGYTVKWDGGSAPTLTANDLETVVITVVGGGSTIEVAPMKGRA